MNFEDLSKEQKIMVTMRTVLTSIIRELTPSPGEKYPLSEPTIQDIRMCLSLIVAREQELANTAGVVNQARPHYIDESLPAQVVAFHPKK